MTSGWTSKENCARIVEFWETQHNGLRSKLHALGFSDTQVSRPIYRILPASESEGFKEFSPSDWAYVILVEVAP